MSDANRSPTFAERLTTASPTAPARFGEAEQPKVDPRDGRRLGRVAQTPSRRFAGIALRLTKRGFPGERVRSIVRRTRRRRSNLRAPRRCAAARLQLRGETFRSLCRKAAVDYRIIQLTNESKKSFVFGFIVRYLPVPGDPREPQDRARLGAQPVPSDRDYSRSAKRYPRRRLS